MEPPKEANNIELQTITEDGIVKIAEDLPKDFGTCPVCGVWVDTLLHWKNLDNLSVHWILMINVSDSESTNLIIIRT